ncbi:MAG: MotA/TolQ/ExbB proton channel family protein [Pseudomonadota bacterium]
MEVLHFFKEGGFVMYPLLVCSIIIWAVVFEKIWFFSRIVRQFNNLYKQIWVLAQDKKMKEAKRVCSNAHPLIALPFTALLEKKNQTKEIWMEHISRRLAETQFGLKRFLWSLATIATIAPFLGLFGTVVGIMRSFKSMAASGKSGFIVIASGLSESLVATAAGILVAVMAVIFHNFFLARLNKIYLEFKNRIEDMAALLSEKQ